MDYNRFYRKRDRRKRRYTGEEKRNLVKVALSFVVFSLVGGAVGIVLVLLLNR